MKSSLLLLLGLAILAPSPASSQSKQSTRDGVYTAAQAERGRITYAGMCKSCHVGAHVGVTFDKLWKGKTVAALYSYTVENMPKSNPGGLEPSEYADVIAYMLKLNAMPAGAVELPADSTALASFVIERPVKASPKRAPTKAAPNSKGKKPC